MTTQPVSKDTSSNQYLLWGVQTLIGLGLTLAVYTYSQDQKTQAEYNAQNNKRVLKIQEQVLDLIKNDATTTQLLIQIQGDVSENKETMKERFDKLEDKIDRIK